MSLDDAVLTTRYCVNGTKSRNPKTKETFNSDYGRCVKILPDMRHDDGVPRFKCQQNSFISMTLSPSLERDNIQKLNLTNPIDKSIGQAYCDNENGWTKIEGGGFGNDWVCAEQDLHYDSQWAPYPSTCKWYVNGECREYDALI